MNKSIFVILAIFMGSLCATTVFASDTWYLRGSADAFFLNDSKVSISSGGSYDITFDPGYGIGVDFGYKADGYRIEAEIAHRSNDVEKFGSMDTTDGDFSSIGFLVSGFLDFETTSFFNPYLGVGAGFTKVDASNITLANGGVIAQEDDTVFAYQFTAGVGFPITNRGTLDVGYSYFRTTDLSWQGVDLEYNAHKVGVAFRISLQ